MLLTSNANHPGGLSLARAQVRLAHPTCLRHYSVNPVVRAAVQPLCAPTLAQLLKVGLAEISVNQLRLVWLQQQQGTAEVLWHVLV